MTGWTPDRLPIAWPLPPGEAIDSWLQSYAARLHTSTRALLQHLGLTRSWLTRMVNVLTADETAVLSAGCGLTPAVLTAATLNRFDGIAVSIDPTNRQLAHPPAWRRQTGSRFCPACLGADHGRWQLRWRLPWTFACLRHHCLLLDSCPACAQRPAPDRPFLLRQPVITGRCSHLAAQPADTRRRGAALGVCGDDLADAPTPALAPDGRVLAAQQRVDRLIDAAVGDVAGRTGHGGTLTEIHVLAFRALRVLDTASAQPPPALVAEILAEAGQPTFPGPLGSYDAVTVAAGTTIALAALAQHHDELIRWLVSSHLEHLSQPEPHKLLDGYKNAGPVLTGRILAALDPHLRTMERITYRTAGPQPQRPATTAQQTTRRASSLPSLLWPAWTLRLAPLEKTGGNPITALRADLAVMLLLSGTPLNCHQAAALLDHPRHRADLDACLPLEPEQRRATLALVNSLAADLDQDPAPINYSRRRALFSAATIDPHAYTCLAHQQGWPALGPLQLHLLDNHLKVLLTGGLHPSGRDRRSADRWNPIAVALPPAVRAFLHEQGRQLLRQHRIREPLTWLPTLPAQPKSPGLAPVDVDHGRFAHAFAAHAGHRCGLRRISEATGLTSTQVRLLVHVIDLGMPDGQWASLATWKHQLGDPDGLAELHHEQHLPMIEITRLGMTTEQSIRTALAQTGRPPLARHPSKNAVPKQWFIDNYVDTQKTRDQAAAELGISPNTFAKYARQHNINTYARTRRSNPFAGWPAQAQPTAGVIAACTTKRGVEYLRQVGALLKHPAQRAAAAALGISEQLLHRRRRYIEQAIGKPLCNPSAPGRPVELTTEGAAFLREATNAIRRLDQEQRS